MKGTYKSEPENYIEVFLQQIDAVKDGRMENGLATEELNIFTGNTSSHSGALCVIDCYKS